MACVGFCNDSGYCMGLRFEEWRDKEYFFSFVCNGSRTYWGWQLRDKEYSFSSACNGSRTYWGWQLWGKEYSFSSACYQSLLNR